MTMPHTMVPKPDDLDLEFYKATVAANALCVQHCKECGTWTHPARYYCPNCFSDKFSFEKASGRATIYSYTVSHFTVEPSWKPFVPYVTIVAELAEGPRIVASAKDFAPDQVVIGAPVKILAEPKSAEFAIFWAAPDKGGA